MIDSLDLSDPERTASMLTTHTSSFIHLLNRYKDLPSTLSQESVSYLLELIRISQLSRESLLSIYNSRLR